MTISLSGSAFVLFLIRSTVERFVQQYVCRRRNIMCIIVISLSGSEFVYIGHLQTRSAAKP